MDNVSISNPVLNNAEILAKLPTGKRAEITILNATSKPSFYMVGNGNRNKSMNKEQNDIVKSFWKEAMNMSPQEQWFMLKIEEHLEPELYVDADQRQKVKTTCKVFIPSSELTNAEKQKLKIAYKRLREKDLIRRIKRQHYMVNPMMLVPTFFDEEFTRYRQLT